MNKVEVNHPSGSEILRESGHRDSNCWCQVLYKHVICTWMWACSEKLKVHANTRYEYKESTFVSAQPHTDYCSCLSSQIPPKHLTQSCACGKDAGRHNVNLSFVLLGSFPKLPEPLPQIRLAIYILRSCSSLVFPSKNEQHLKNFISTQF